ncbi:MAG: YitT family protein [Hydrogenibacillus schlegelii]|uniref:Membrane protein n=1 Tax=Hydrogenibacillus schlegelii TaxID=1484 RepID=A0A2T5G6Y0_HYDSH|nr:YitT family protein [Hydrogenibacillus schlegelii]MBT9282948.1 YitT family protein [Hydrogenibacillus schlegelii]PTQ51940.1 MAG: membrane protein [Hydrogenibacillus schlegelii]
MSYAFRRVRAALDLGLIAVFSVVLAVGYNFFLLPHKVLSGGVSGIAMMIGLLTPLNPGTLIFLLNLPLFVFGFFTLGRLFILRTILSVVLTALAMNVLPVEPIATDALLSSVFGGAVVGLATGMIFSASGSTGGLDIIGMFIARRMDFPMGMLMSATNALIIFVAGFLFSWDQALYTMLSIYVSGRIVDAIFTRHIKLTLLIVTGRGEAVREALLRQIVRGITVLEGIGAYSKEKKTVLMTVATRYELPLIKSLIRQADPHAFVNILQTVEVVGAFTRLPLDAELRPDPGRRGPAPPS